MKIYIIAALLIISSLVAIFFQGKKVERQTQFIEKQKEKIDQQNQQMEKKNELIESKNYQQRIIGKTSVNLDLAARGEWMQLVFEERKAANN